MSITNNNRFSRPSRLSNNNNDSEATTSPNNVIEDKTPSSNFKPSDEKINSNIERFQTLKVRYDKLKNVRTKREFELEQNEKELQHCLEEAKKFGVSSLAELRELIKQKQKEENEALNIFEESLEKEESMLSEMEENLKRVD